VGRPVTAEAADCRSPAARTCPEDGGQHWRELAHGRQDPCNPHMESDAGTQTGGRLALLLDRMLTSAQLDAIPAPDPLIAGHLYADSIAELWGRPGSGKSFLAIDWALCVATGKPWQQHAVQQGRVLYIVGEGAGGMSKRRRAWEQAWGNHDDGAMTWLRGAVPLIEIGWVYALAEAVRKLQPRLVVVDTVSRAIAGHNENAPETMCALVRNTDQIREAAAGACVLFVHHATKDGNTTRGHSALEGACDVRWKLAKEGNGLVLSNPKAKDDAEASDRNLRLAPWDLGTVDEFGKPITSCVVESHGHSLTVDELNDSETRLLAVMRDSFGTTAATGPALRRLAKLPKTTHYRALNALLRKGALTNSGTGKRPLYCLAPTLGEVHDEL